VKISSNVPFRIVIIDKFERQTVVKCNQPSPWTEKRRKQSVRMWNISLREAPPWRVDNDRWGASAFLSSVQHQLPAENGPTSSGTSACSVGDVFSCRNANFLCKVAWDEFFVSVKRGRGSKYITASWEPSSSGHTLLLLVYALLFLALIMLCPSPNVH
jgi:hypothetical protein